MLVLAKFLPFDWPEIGPNQYIMAVLLTIGGVLLFLKWGRTGVKVRTGERLEKKLRPFFQETGITGQDIPTVMRLLENSRHPAKDKLEKNPALLGVLLTAEADRFLAAIAQAGQQQIQGLSLLRAIEKTRARLTLPNSSFASDMLPPGHWVLLQFSAGEGVNLAAGEFRFGEILHNTPTGIEVAVRGLDDAPAGNTKARLLYTTWPTKMAAFDSQILQCEPLAPAGGKPNSVEKPPGGWRLLFSPGVFRLSEREELGIPVKLPVYITDAAGQKAEMGWPGTMINLSARRILVRRAGEGEPPPRAGFAHFQYDELPLMIPVQWVGRDKQHERDSGEIYGFHFVSPSENIRRILNYILTPKRDRGARISGSPQDGA